MPYKNMEHNTNTNNKRRNVLLIYFSGSGSTKAISELFSEKLRRVAFNVTMVELSIFTKTQIIDDFEFIVFGTPTYHCSPPKTVIEFINKIDFQQKKKKVFIFATYGLYVGNNIRSIAKKLLLKNLICIGFTGFRGPASDASMLFPQRIRFIYRYEKRIQWKLDTAVKEIEESFTSENTKQKIPFFKWYAPLDYIPNQIFARKRFSSVYCNQIELIDERWDGKKIPCPRNCWTIKNRQAFYDARNCEFCMRCIHRTPNKAVVFSKKMKDRPRLDEEFYAKRIEEIRS